MLAAAVAFAACGSLQYITFPKTVTTVGTKLVTDLTSLLAVRYIGTEDEWNASDFKTQEFSEYLREVRSEERGVHSKKRT